jgi:hypothetical protein
MDDSNQSGSMLSTPHAAAVIVIGSLVFLYMINRGFHGVSVGGVSVGVH